MKDMLLIVPSRGRQEKVVKFKEYFDKHSTITDLCFGLDNDEHQSYPQFDDVIYDINPNMKLGPKLNTISAKYCDKYRYIAFMGDDHWIKTPAWDQKILEPIRDVKYGMAYGNDLLKGEMLPTAVVMDSRIIKTLGYMCPPGQQHLYLDDFWMYLGNCLGTLHYCPDVIIEHMHFTAGKSDIDEVYAASNAPELYQSDFAIYQDYINNKFVNDMQKFKP